MTTPAKTARQRSFTSRKSTTRNKALNESASAKSRLPKRKRKRTVISTSTHIPCEQSEAPAQTDSLSREDVISQYHQKQKQLSAALRATTFPNEAARASRVQLLRAQLHVLGLERYQTASLEGERLGGGFDSSAWVLCELRTRALASALRLLDVGAIVARFPNTIETERGDDVKLDATAIDLNPRVSEVLRADFFNYAGERLRDGMPGYHVVCLCLCVNFVGCARRRGEMLRLAAAIAEKDALLFLSLPRACVDNSRYFDKVALEDVLKAAGWVLASLQYSASLVLVVCTRGDNVPSEDNMPVIRKRIMRKGADRNNFAIEMGEKNAGIEGYKRKGVLAEGGDASGNRKKGARSKVGAAQTPKTRASHGVKKMTTSNQRKRARRKAKGSS